MTRVAGPAGLGHLGEMPPAFTLGHIIGPVAVATVLNVFVFALFWRWERTEVRTGTPPWPFWVALPLYLLPIGAFTYFTLGQPITTPSQVFAGAIGGEMFGGCLVYGLLNAFLWSRGQPIRERLFPMAICGGLFAFMAAAVFS